MKGPLVSVVVTTKNEERNIENCLRSIREQSYPWLETIVVDNFSTDATRRIALRYGANVATRGPERSAQRNWGMATMSAGAYVMYVDADMILGPTVVEECVRTIEGDSCVALYIPEIVLGTTCLCRVRRYERSFYDGTVIDAARFFRKDVFVETGGFNESMSGPEDWDLDNRIGREGRIRLVGPSAFTGGGAIENWSFYRFISENGGDPGKNRAAIFHNESKLGLIDYLTKKAYYSDSISQYAKKWGDTDACRKQLGFFYRYFLVFVQNGNWKKILRNPVLALGMLVARVAVGAVYMTKKITT
ncbi:MAG: glycosyltransferase [Chloroflexi bacterium]|nr:glycosyltransferase [Chloroflexota bacterium]